MACLMVTGTEASEAKFQAVNICKVISQDLNYEQLKKYYKKGKLANELELMNFEPIENEEVVVLIEDHFTPDHELIKDESGAMTDGGETTEMESDDSEMESENPGKIYFDKFFAKLENNEDSRKANQRQVEQKKLFLPMRKHFQAQLTKLNKPCPDQKAQDMVNAWIQSKKKPSDLKKIFENNVLKRKSEIALRFAKILEKADVPFAKPLANWTTDFFLNNMDQCGTKIKSLAHNDFRKKKILRLQVEQISRNSYAELQHFYEILHKFHARDDFAPQTAQKYVEAWILSGFKIEDVTGLFVSAVHLPQFFEQLSLQLLSIFDKASPFFLKDVDPRVLLEYTAMYFLAKIKLAKGRLTKLPENEDNAENWTNVKQSVLNMTHEEKDYNEFEPMIRGKYKLQTLHQIMKDITTMTSNAPTHKSAFRAALQVNPCFYFEYSR